MIKKLFLFLISLWILGTGKAWSLEIEGALGIWSQDPWGEIAYKGDALTMDKNLDFDMKDRFYGRLRLNLPLVNFYLGFTPVEFDGEGRKDASFRFGDVVFNGTLPFDSYLSIDQYDIGIFWGIPFLKTATKVATLGFAGINLELGINLRVLDIKAKIEQETVGKEEKSFLIPIPMIYGGLFLDFGRLALEGEVRGMNYQDNHYYDVVVRLKGILLKPVPLGPSLFVGVGYKYQNLELDIKDIEGSLELTGPFFEIGGSF
ncbi:TIGR04219 family outer membrane beta-barrel protein [Thermosulfurimonas dismutans]|uniref:TIGR04219 family outer membrane beta-barrel protein n=1 Tax=Thermosulfurimonas dismutans TaxID=999894 RepID=A0A179D4E5_9BACT|nr:TIGR04219 family outer membrane beta-barrel protein [Thermosulfurimonas dismutans]OAQ20935.1 hypothetical protein TDIS_0861 [Thermosulfurimonas dismutans]